MTDVLIGGGVSLRKVAALSLRPSSLRPTCEKKDDELKTLYSEHPSLVVPIDVLFYSDATLREPELTLDTMNDIESPMTDGYVYKSYPVLNDTVFDTLFANVSHQKRTRTKRAHHPRLKKNTAKKRK